MRSHGPVTNVGACSGTSYRSGPTLQTRLNTLYDLHHNRNWWGFATELIQTQTSAEALLVKQWVKPGVDPAIDASEIVSPCFVPV